MSALRLKIPWLGFGSPGWIRTSDQLLRRQMLFPLSYRQIGGTGRIRTFDHSVNSRTHNRCASDPENEKAQGVNLGLEFFCLGTIERIPSVRDKSNQFFRK